MLKEEWRLHSRLFGRWGFAGFPVVVFTVTALAYGLLAYSGFTVQELEVGLHYVVAFLGLSVGSIGFVSSDAVENLLGESNLLVYSSRTLPVSSRRLVSAFVVKDLIYYFFMYMLPLTLALIPVSLYFTSPFTNLPLLLFTVTGAFMLGVSVSFFGAVVYLRSRAASTVVGVAAVATVAAAYFTGYYDVVVTLTPLGFYSQPSLESLLLGYTPLAAAVALGVIAFSPGSSGRDTEHSARYGVMGLLPTFDDTGLTAKILLDMTRSSGGVLKIFFSVGMLFLVFVFLVLYIDIVRDIISSPGLAFATLLAISSISVYHWLNRFDRPEDYLMLPVDAGDVIAAKFRALLLLSLSASYVYLLIAAALFGFGEMLLGAALLPLLTVYFFGATVYMTGLDPNELLLNSKLFAAFGVVVAAVALPMFVAAIAYVEFPRETATFTIALSLAAFAVGILLYRRSKVKWLDKEAS